MSSLLSKHATDRNQKELGKPGFLDGLPRVSRIDCGQVLQYSKAGDDGGVEDRTHWEASFLRKSGAARRARIGIAGVRVVNYATVTRGTTDDHDVDDEQKGEGVKTAQVRKQLQNHQHKHLCIYKVNGGKNVKKSLRGYISSTNQT